MFSIRGWVIHFGERYKDGFLSPMASVPGVQRVYVKYLYNFDANTCIQLLYDLRGTDECTAEFVCEWRIKKPPFHPGQRVWHYDSGPMWPGQVVDCGALFVDIEFEQGNIRRYYYVDFKKICAVVD